MIGDGSRKWLGLVCVLAAGALAGAAFASWANLPDGFAPAVSAGSAAATLFFVVGYESSSHVISQASLGVLQAMFARGDWR